MDLPRGRCSSIPRDYTKRRRRGFSIEDASVLRVKLVALDKLLDSAPIAEHHALDFEQALQQQGPAEPDKELTESLFDLLDESKIPCPDGIATAFVQAYTAALAGHQYVNEYKIIDLTKGPECTCSMALNILFQIDVLLNTKLRTHFNAVYARVKPFPFLQLPGELRLHVYSYHLPRAPYLSLFDKPLPSCNPPRADLRILRTSRQLHNEASKYFYENRKLFIGLTKGHGFEAMDYNGIARVYEITASIPHRTRTLFRHLDIMVGYVGLRADVRRYPEIKPVDDPFRETLALLPNLGTVLISFRPGATTTVAPITDRKAAVLWLIDAIPESITLLWDYTDWRDKAGEDFVSRGMEKRGGVKLGESVARQMQK